MNYMNVNWSFNPAAFQSRLLTCHLTSSLLQQFTSYHLVKGVTEYMLQQTNSSTLRWFKIKHSRLAYWREVLGVLDYSMFSFCVCVSCRGPGINVSQLINASLDTLTSSGFVTSPSVSLRWQRDSMTAKGTLHANGHKHARCTWSLIWKNHMCKKAFQGLYQTAAASWMWCWSKKEPEASDKTAYLLIKCY